MTRYDRGTRGKKQKELETKNENLKRKITFSANGKERKLEKFFRRKHKSKKENVRGIIKCHLYLII